MNLLGAPDRIESLPSLLLTAPPPPRTAPQIQSPDPAIRAWAGRCTPSQPPARRSATACDCGRRPSSPTLLPAPYLTARGSDASAVRQPTRPPLSAHTSQRAPGDRQFARPPVRHCAPPPRHAGAWSPASAGARCSAARKERALTRELRALGARDLALCPHCTDKLRPVVQKLRRRRPAQIYSESGSASKSARV